ncbi:unnamed protein product [Ilex paraguariensis]|uniref:Uncharacterized protein n=1 Tax=Ilex paraguariensis TaxID=185542 RepID=A0ABC8RKS4_9AQUA
MESKPQKIWKYSAGASSVNPQNLIIQSRVNVNLESPRQAVDSLSVAARQVLETGDYGKDVFSLSLNMLEENQSSPNLQVENPPSNIHQENQSVPHLQADNPPSNIHEDIPVEQNQENERQLDDAAQNQLEDSDQCQLEDVVQCQLNNAQDIREVETDESIKILRKGDHSGKK